MAPDLLQHQLLTIVIPALLDQVLVEPHFLTHTRTHHPGRADLRLEYIALVQDHSQTWPPVQPVPQALALEQEAQLRGHWDQVGGDGREGDEVVGVQDRGRAWGLVELRGRGAFLD